MCALFELWSFPCFCRTYVQPVFLYPYLLSFFGIWDCICIFICICKIWCSPVNGWRSTHAVKRRNSFTELCFIAYSPLHFDRYYLNSQKILIFFFCLFWFYYVLLFLFFSQYFALLFQFHLFCNQSSLEYFLLCFNFWSLWRI